MIHHGSCHCGRITFDLDAEIDQVIDCNCSMCRRRGGLLAFFPRPAFTLKSPDADASTYRFSKGHIAHRFCPVCGVAPYSEGTHPKTGEAIVAINVRCLPDVDLATLKIKPVDGASL